MKRITMILCTILVLIMAGLTACSSQGNETASADSASAPNDATKAADLTEAVSNDTVGTRDRDAEYKYETREIWCSNNGTRIYGVAYIPISESETRFPLVIHAHGMGSNHEAGAGYAERYAEKGFAAYTFDFPGGSRPTTENKSDGDPMDNSAVTEAADLQAILDTALTWDFVDTDNVFLEGGSMGGLVATMVGLDNTDTVKGLILHYPALYMPQIVTARYGSPDDVPDTISFGDDYELGKRFVTDLFDVDVISRIGDYQGNVTIIQGSEDQLVAASSIEEASALFPHAEFHLIEGAGHGFSDDYFETSVVYGMDYLFNNT